MSKLTIALKKKKNKYNWHLNSISPPLCFAVVFEQFCWKSIALSREILGTMTEQKLEPQHLCLCALFQTLTFLIERLIWQAGQSNGESRQVRKLDSRLGFAVAEFVQGCDCLCFEWLLCSPFCKGRWIPGVHQNFPCLIKRSGSVNVVKKSCWQKGQRHPKRSCMRKFWTVNPKLEKKQKKTSKNSQQKQNYKTVQHLFECALKWDK